MKESGRHLAGMAQWIEHRPANQRVTGQFPVRAHAWVAGQGPSKGCARGNHTLMFLSLSFSLSSPLSKINQSIKSKKKKEPGRQNPKDLATTWKEEGRVLKTAQDLQSSGLGFLADACAISPSQK